MVLRLAGPLQSWGEHSTFTDRDTLRYPTRSGVIGMFAAAQGLRRGDSLERYAPLSFTVRVDRPGVHLTDFHTVGGGLSRERTVPTAAGGHRPEGTATMVTRRVYLSDAVFTVAVEGPHALIGQIAAALQRPHWQPYLGRRSCPPDPPLLLNAETDTPVADLYHRVPLPRRRTIGQDHVTVDMITETPGPGGMLTEVADIPAVFGRYDRQYRSRAIYRHTAQLPAALALWRNTADYHRALAEYARTPS